MSSNNYLPSISVGGLDYIENFTTVCAAAFANDPYTRTFISENYGHSADGQTPLRRLFSHFLPLLESGAASGAELVEAGGWKAVALCMPPVSTEQPQNAKK